MARNLESELARLSRAVRRRVILLQPRGVPSADPIPLTARDRAILAWARTGGRLIPWLRRALRR
jgi:hypothetical protein